METLGHGEKSWFRGFLLFSYENDNTEGKTL